MPARPRLAGAMRTLLTHDSPFNSSAEYEKAKRSWMDNEELHKTERYLEEDHRVGTCRAT